MPLTSNEKSVLQAQAAVLSNLVPAIAAAVLALQGQVDALVVDAAAPAPVPVPAPPAPVPAPPAPTPEPPPAPPPAPTGAAIYFSESGLNTNPGTLAAPKRDLTGIDVNLIHPSIALRFERGSTFNFPQLKLFNPQATAAQRLTFEDYGVGPRPVIQWASNIGFEFGRNFNDQAAHGGYAFRNLILCGPDNNANTWGFWPKGNVSDVLIEGCEISNWYFAVESQGGATHAARRFAIRGCSIVNNRGMGVHGQFFESTIEDNLFQGNVQVASHLVHNIYLRNGDYNRVISNRMFSDAPATGGTLTIHGRVENSLVIAYNDIVYGPGSDEGAWCISVREDDNNLPGGFHGLVVRGNKITNAGNTAINVMSAVGAVIEDNEIHLTHVRNQVAVSLSNNTEKPGDYNGPGTVRNNRAFGPAGCSFSYVASPGSTTDNNTVTID